MERFVGSVAAPTPTPGGGSVSALAGALAASLGEMVCGLTLKRKLFETHHSKLEAARSKLAAWREQLLENIDRDAQSYNAVMAAFKLPKSTEAEHAARVQAIEEASKAAAEVPLQTAEKIREVLCTVRSLCEITISPARSDLIVALCMAEAGLQGSKQNVRANLPSIQDTHWVGQAEQKLKEFEASE